MAPDFPVVAVVGCGLVGGSFALASRAVEGVERLVVTDRDPAVRQAAARRGIADAVVDTVEEAVAGADLVLVAVPVDAIAGVVRAVLRAAPVRAVVTDVGSVKSDPVREVQGRLRGRAPEEAGGAEPEGDPRFLGGHPMAGSEQSGLDGADAALFVGATWVLTPTADSEPAVFNRLARHLRALGARVLAVDPETHDRIVATASHLPQVVASTLADEAEAAARATGDGVLSVAAGGFRDVTRIAESDPDLWTGILAQNRDAVLGALRSFGARLEGIVAAVEDGDWEEVRDRLQRGRAARQRLPVKDRAAEPLELVVPIPDRPGMLAAVTTALGAAGINIEDLAIRHAPQDARGALVVTVAGRETAGRARDVLAAEGFNARLRGR